jgi:hypothetical protein
MVGSGLTDATREDRSRCVIRGLPLCRRPNGCFDSPCGARLRWKHLNLRRQVYAGPKKVPAAKTAPRARGPDAEARPPVNTQPLATGPSRGSGPAPSRHTVGRSAGRRESATGLPHECGACCRLPSRRVDRRPTGRDVLQEEKCGPPTPDYHARASGPSLGRGRGRASGGYHPAGAEPTIGKDVNLSFRLS